MPRRPPGHSFCIHLGGATRYETCGPCDGKARLKIHPCALHGECSLSEKASVRHCGNCRDRQSAAPSGLEAVTACITHYERPEQLKRLLASIERHVPGLRVLVEETGGNLSAARNRLAARCTTPFYLMLEEDFVFTGQTDIAGMLRVLEGHPELGGVAGCTNEPRGKNSAGRGGRIWWDRDFVRIRDTVHLAAGRSSWRTEHGVRWRPCDLVVNFGVFRTETMRAIPWDERLPVMEHTDWYYRAWLDGRWRFGYAPDVLVDHLRERPSDLYRRQRRRDFTPYLRKKLGIRFEKDSKPPTLAVPNIVLLSVGRSNSSIVTKMAAHAFGLNLGDIDPRYYEHRGVRRVNCSQKDGKIDRLAARRVLRRLPQPWIIKDPRFRRTLPQWRPLVEPFSPLLVYLVKNPETVRESYAKQNWSYDPADHDRCDRLFREWTGPKLRVRAEDIGIACSFFDHSRLKLADATA